MLFALPLILLIGIPIGLIRLFTNFGILFALPAIVLIISALFAEKYHKIKIALLLVLTAAIGQWLSFFSWIASRQSINAEQATHQWGMNLPSVAKSGFPISALELPPSPMGSDNVPVDMWYGVFTNQLIWFLVAFVIALLIVLTIKKLNKKIIPVCIIITIFAVIYNLALFTFWYD